jgi:multidrug efflux pump subunit AcrB
VFYDSSSFVAATIDEVEKTLAIAFALVVLVVFLFLGNIRATIIPIVAIPVSLIGTFAVLLAVGFSANTVSLLALVLGIGVAVDDAIVVVENAERVMAENPDMPPGEATKMAMRQITGPVIAISLVLLSVFVPVGFIPGVSGTLFRQFAVTISVAMLISAINALTLSPALCGVFCATMADRAARCVGYWRHRRGAQRLRRGGATAVARLGPGGAAADRGGRRHLAARRAHADRFPPEEDQGAFFVAVQLPGWRPRCARARWAADEACSHRCRRWGVVDASDFRCSTAATSRTPFVAVRLEAVRRPYRGRLTAHRR